MIYRIWNKNRNKYFTKKQYQKCQLSPNGKLYIESYELTDVKIEWGFNYGGKKYFEGDILDFPYITPFAEIEIDDYDYDKRSILVFKCGCFGIDNSTSIVPFMEYIERKKGDYVPNKGNIVIYGTAMVKVIGNINENLELMETKE